MQRTAVAFYRVVSPAVETKCTFISALLHTQTATNTQTQVTHAYRRVECTHTISPYVHEDIRGMLPGAGIGRNEAWLARCCTALWKPGPNKYKKNNAKKNTHKSILTLWTCLYARPLAAIAPGLVGPSPLCRCSRSVRQTEITDLSL